LNFLAHFHLAWPDHGLVAGGLEGDYYKGPLRGDLSQALERGVRLHRAIDAFTDDHPTVRQLRRDFPPTLRRYAGILIDLSFDHFLSKHWQLYSEMPLTQFTAAVYRVLQSEHAQLSADSRIMLERLVQHDILGLYRDWEAIPASAARIGQRFRRGNPLAGVERQLDAVRDVMERGFLTFYPELRDFCASQRSLLNQTWPGTSNIAPVAKST
jgi:acyl carrier protein phosphodiesterase